MQRKHRTLPTLDFLKGFESAARHLSFTKAASELFVTQSAVSRQIQSLEEQLGVVLFQRRPKDLVLTEAGETLYRTASEILRQVRDAMERLDAAGRTEALTVTCTVAFASLVPFGSVPNAPSNPFPAGFDAKPAPFGVSFVGVACSEPKLISLAYGFEQATKRRRPPTATP